MRRGILARARSVSLLSLCTLGLAAALSALPGCSGSGPTAPSSGRTFLVDLTGQGDYVTIQAAIAVAATGDTVLVMPGTYTGPDNKNLDFGGRNIVLKAATARDSVVVDCQGEGRGFYLHGGEGPSSVIEGFVIVGGFAGVEGEADGCGGGAYLQGASPTFRNVVFRDNVALVDGGGMYCARDDRSMRPASPTLEDVVFERNEATFSGGALVCYKDSNARLTRVTFIENYAGSSGGGMSCIFASPVMNEVAFVRNIADAYGGGLSCYTSSPTIDGATFLANGATYGYGGAIALSGSGPQIRNATIVNNAAILAGGIHCRDLSSPVIRASIMAFNMGTGAVYCDGEDTPDTQRSCVFQNDGGDILCGTSADILSLDPLFCNVNEDDLTLCSNSPCLPGGNPWGITIGDHGEGCSDCGSTLGGAPWRRWASTVAW